MVILGLSIVECSGHPGTLNSGAMRECSGHPGTLNSGAARECSCHPGLCQKFTLTDQFYFIVLFHCFTRLNFYLYI